MLASTWTTVLRLCRRHDASVGGLSCSLRPWQSQRLPSSVGQSSSENTYRKHRLPWEKTFNQRWQIQTLGVWVVDVGPSSFCSVRLCLAGRHLEETSGIVPIAPPSVHACLVLIWNSKTPWTSNIRKVRLVVLFNHISIHRPYSVAEKSRAHQLNHLRPLQRVRVVHDLVARCGRALRAWGFANLIWTNNHTNSEDQTQVPSVVPVVARVLSHFSCFFLFDTSLDRVLSFRD